MSSQKAYQEFDEIHRRMERAYEAGSDDWRIAGGIVAIYTKMCTDGLLRRKIHGPGEDWLHSFAAGG